MVDRRRGSVGLAAAAFGEEVAAPVAGGARHGDAVLAGGGALGEEVVAGVDARPAGALGAARLLGPCLLICIISFSIDRQDSRDMLQVVKKCTLSFGHSCRDQKGLEKEDRQQSAALHLHYYFLLLPTLVATSLVE